MKIELNRYYLGSDGNIWKCILIQDNVPSIKRLGYNGQFAECHITNAPFDMSYFTLEGNPLSGKENGEYMSNPFRIISWN